MDERTQASRAGSLWIAREATRALLFPVWPPLAAPVEHVDESLPVRVAFHLRFHRWQLRIRLQSYGPEHEWTDDINLEAAVRPADWFGRVAQSLAKVCVDGWEPFAFARLPAPVTVPDIENAMNDVRRALWERPDIAQFVNRLYLRQ